MGIPHEKISDQFTFKLQQLKNVLDVVAIFFHLIWGSPAQPEAGIISS